MLSSIKPRKRSSTDQLVDQPNKRQAQGRTETETETETMPGATTTAVLEHTLQKPSPMATDSLANMDSHHLLDAIDNLMRKYHDAPASRPPLKATKEHLAGYVAQSDEDRAKGIDNLICECIQDENFGRLMDDVEGAWKRVGLGW